VKVSDLLGSWLPYAFAHQKEKYTFHLGDWKKYFLIYSTKYEYLPLVILGH
jgi:hypothetical protein